ncbi:hypothetical protein [Bacillus sp. AK031]
MEWHRSINHIDELWNAITAIVFFRSKALHHDFHHQKGLSWKYALNVEEKITASRRDSSVNSVVVHSDEPSGEANLVNSKHIDCSQII